MSVVIVDIIKEIVESMQVDGVPYYDHGHPIEMVNTLLEKDGNDTWKFKKYPLIYLRQDFKESMTNDGLYTTISNLDIFILNNTSMDYTSEQRYTNVLKPILYPLFEAFIKKVSQSTKLANPVVDYDKYDRLFWGTSAAMGNEANILNDPIDAIEINLIDLKVQIEIFNLNC